MKAEYRGLGAFGTLGLEIVLCTLVGFWGGHWIDGKLGTEPGFTLFGLVCGLGAAGKAVLRTMKDMRRVTLQEEREQGNPAPLPDPKERAEDDDEDKDAVSKEDDDGGTGSA